VDLPKPDLLDTMHIRKVDYLSKGIFHFMNTKELLEKYNAIWLSGFVYCHFISKNMSYEDVSQWQGEEMKQMSWYLLGVVAQSL
jgi:hypothetical protein